MRKTKTFFKLSVAISACLLANSAIAITTVEGNAGLQFSFNNPGARSLAMGGAFLALADDATAAYTNPAGLSNLYRPEFSIEYRNTDYSSLYSNIGRLLQEPTGLGIDTIPYVTREESSEKVDSLSFLSFVFPMEKWTLGVYRHQLADFKTSFQSQGPIIQTRILGSSEFPFISRAAPSINDVDLEIVNWGLSASFRISDSLSIGAGFSYYDLNFDTVTQRFKFESGASPQRWMLVDFDELEEDALISQTGDDDAFGFNVGLLWSVNEKWSVGLIYRHGVEFDYEHLRVLSSGSISGGTTDFNVPSVYGAGVAFRPLDQFTLSLDINRITYSDITKNVVLQGSGDPVDYLAVDDGTEIRLGGEYVFATKNPFALRAGIWRDPEHVIRHVGEIVPTDLGDPLRRPQDTSNTRAAYFQPK